jgi:predicted oxidoreductase
VPDGLSIIDKEQGMKTIQIPNTPYEATRIGYGCMAIGGGWDTAPLTAETRARGLAAVRAALDEGINFYDHADIYARGKSEEVFAGIWQERPGLRPQIIVQSKCGIRFAGDGGPDAPSRFDFSYEHIINSVNGSLKRLQTDYLDILLLHRPDALVEPQEVARAFDDLQQSGKVRFFGVSDHTAAQIELLRRYVRQPFVLNQLEINIIHTHLFDEGIVFNNENLPQPIRNEGTLEYCRLHDILIQAWSPLARGLLSGRQPEMPDVRTDKAAELVAQLAQEKGVSPEAIIIAWLLRHPAPIQPVIGTTNPARIHAACEADHVTLTREEWYRLYIAGRGNTMP